MNKIEAGKSENLTNRGRGRPKGSPNKQTKEIKEMLLQSLHDSGGAEYFRQLAIDNSSAYASLIGKIIPAEVKNQITGADGGPVQHAIKVNFGDGSKLSSET